MNIPGTTLSTTTEWHSFGHGVYAGMRDLAARPGDLPEIEDVQEEPHYYKGGYILGTLFQLIVMLVVVHLL